jgi:hypothetical protein
VSQPQISLNFANGNNVVLNVEPTRPLNSLPFVFWIQILVGLCSFLIGGWVWAISHKRYTTFILFVAGCCIMAASFSAAIYSTRVLALPAPYLSYCPILTIRVPRCLALYWYYYFLIILALVYCHSHYNFRL